MIYRKQWRGVGIHSNRIISLLSLSPLLIASCALLESIDVKNVKKMNIDFSIEVKPNNVDDSPQNS